MRAVKCWALEPEPTVMLALEPLGPVEADPVTGPPPAVNDPPVGDMVTAPPGEPGAEPARAPMLTSVGELETVTPPDPGR